MTANSRNDEFDLVIIGSGGGGLCAALRAHELGLRPLVLEKSAFIGGTTALSGGVLWIPNNPVILRRGVPDSYVTARTYLDACVGTGTPGSSPARREAFLRQGPKMVEFLEACGVKFVHAEGFSCYHEMEKPGGMARGRGITSAIFDLDKLGPWQYKLYRRGFHYPTVTHEAYSAALGGRTLHSLWSMMRIGLRMTQNWLGRRLAGLGLALQGQMLKQLLDRNIPVWTEANVTEFVREDNKVVGVRVEHEGEHKTVRATAGVLIAAGGFARNLAMRERFQPKPTSDVWTRTNPYDTGVIMQMAMDLGAAVDAMDQTVWTLVSRQKDGASYPHSAEMGKPHLILVDSTGQRYVNESTSYMAVGQAMYRRNQEVPAVPSWFVMDSRFLKRYRWGSISREHPIEAWVARGDLKRADSIEDLARQCGIPPAALAATTRRFNEFAREGVDHDFHRGESNHDRFLGDPRVKPNSCLGAIDRAPFYAMKAWPGDVGTCGGLLTDEHARVLDGTGHPIPGLYAAGNSTASPMGSSYPGPGASVGPSFVYGFIAAEDAAKRRSHLGSSDGGASGASRQPQGDTLATA